MRNTSDIYIDILIGFTGSSADPEPFFMSPGSRYVPEENVGSEGNRIRKFSQVPGLGRDLPGMVEMRVQYKG
jgi:hypothetical protein